MQLEKARRTFEEIDALERDLADTLYSFPADGPSKLAAEHTLAAGLCALQKQAAAALASTADASGLLAAEVSHIASAAELEDTEELLAAFDADCAAVLDKLPGSTGTPSMPGQAEQVEPQAARAAGAPAGIAAVAGAAGPAFSAEELGGACMDLQAWYTAWLNASSTLASELTYLTWLQGFDATAAAPFVTDATAIRGNKAYKHYLQGLCEYLAGFHRRVMPLVAVEDVIRPALAKLAQAALQERASALGSGQLDLATVRSAKALEKLGAARLKAELSARGLKMGGQLPALAQRLWAVKGLSPAQYPAKLKAKQAGAAAGAAGAADNGSAAVPAAGVDAHGTEPGSPPDLLEQLAASSQSHDVSQLAWPPSKRGIPLVDVFPAGRWRTLALEEAIQALSSAHHDQIDATVKRAARKHTRTFAELEADRAEEADQAALLQQAGLRTADAGLSDSDEEGPTLYDPNKVVDWEGKPIPYWQYKLHGMNLTFDCEICGDVRYRGPLAYHQHFSQHQHTEKLRALGIPYSDAFDGVAKIDDAVALWKSIQQKDTRVTFNPDVEEEFEDSHGNVLGRKVYEDLSRQGLL